MGATDDGRRFERRRFLTRHDIDDAAAAGRPIQLQARDVLTDEAAQRARDLGVRVEHDRAGSGRVPVEELRRAVRAAVVAELGAEPPGLDAAIDRVLSSRRAG